MSKIGLFYGTDTGNTENVAMIIRDMLGEDNVDVFNFGETEASEVEGYDFLLLGAPTWYDGELQSDWEDIVPEFQGMDFSGKKVAIFGLGDQWGYGEWFVDAIGIIGDVIKDNGGEICGYWPNEGYEFDESKGLKGDRFMGLPIDEDNQPEMTEDRLNTWVPQVLQEFGIEVETA